MDSHEIVIIDNRALIVSVLRELCTALYPEHKARVFESPSEYLESPVRSSIVVASTDFVGDLFMQERPWEKRDEFKASVVVMCGEGHEVKDEQTDFVIDLRSSAADVVSILRQARAQVSGELKASTSRPDGLTPTEMGIRKGRQLTPRQISILQLSAEGLSAQEIADELHVTVNTIRGHTQEIFARLNVKNIAHAVAFYTKLDKLRDFGEEETQKD